MTPDNNVSRAFGFVLELGLDLRLGIGHSGTISVKILPWGHMKYIPHCHETEINNCTFGKSFIDCIIQMTYQC